MMILVYIIVAISALFFIVPLLLPGQYRVEKSIVINKNPEHVFTHVADLNKYRDWNPWQKMEPGAKANISGTPKTVGHRFDWEGKKIGQGSLTIRSLDPYKKADLALEFVKPWKAKADDNWTFEDLNNGSTKVSWCNQGPLAYPMARLMGPMVNKNLNDQFEKGLKDLKEMCEK